MLRRLPLLIKHHLSLLVNRHLPLLVNRHQNSWLLSLYLGLAPVYHLLGTGDEYLRLFKIALAVAGVAIVLVPPLLSGELRLPAWVLGPPGFLALILLSAPGVIQAPKVFLNFMFVMDIGFAAGLMWCFFWLARQGENVSLIFTRALAITLPLAAFALASALAKIPNWTNPCDQLWRPEYSIGFGSSPTQWSISLILLLPLVGLLMGEAAKWRLEQEDRAMLGAALAGILFGSQFMTGGRTGFLISAVSIAILAFPRQSRWLAYSGVAAGVVLGGIIVFSQNQECSKHIGLDRVLALADVDRPSAPAAPEPPPEPVVRTEPSPKPSLRPPTGPSVDRSPAPEPALSPFLASLDTLGTTRFEGYKISLRRIAERPFLGYGLEKVLLRGHRKPEVEIHNLWLKWSTYSGILAPLWFAIMVGLVLLTTLRLVANRDDAPENRFVAAMLGLIVISGLTASMLEPNALIGSFQYTAIWWAAAGALVGIYAKERGLREWSLRFSTKRGLEIDPSQAAVN